MCQLNRWDSISLAQGRLRQCSGYLVFLSLSFVFVMDFIYVCYCFVLCLYIFLTEFEWGFDIAQVVLSLSIFVYHCCCACDCIRLTVLLGVCEAPMLSFIPVSISLLLLLIMMFKIMKNIDQACYWYQQGCSIGCPTCDSISGRVQVNHPANKHINK